MLRGSGTDKNFPLKKLLEYFTNIKSAKDKMLEYILLERIISIYQGTEQVSYGIKQALFKLLLVVFTKK